MSQRPSYYDPTHESAPEPLEVDVCVYGGTSAGVMAAVDASRQGLKVVLVAPEHHLGGMSAGGLGWTDFGRKHVIGGLAAEFYRRVGTHYGEHEPVWHFEPRVAEAVFEALVAEADVPVYRGRFLKTVTTDNNRIRSLETEDGLVAGARVFVDATYEGDLMAAAGITYTVGREGNRPYGEVLNGVQFREKHQFEWPVSPYRREGDATSGLLPGISSEPPSFPGSGDHRIQAYNFRLCLTRRDDIRVPFPEPEDYDPERYTLLARYLQAGWRDVFRKFDLLRNDKTDTNNHGAISTDCIGMNYDYPEANYVEREHIFQEHLRWHRGWCWFLSHDKRVPADIRNEMATWGLCADEFVSTGGWPHQLYIREARRMVSDVVVTEHHCMGRRREPDPVALGSYNMDSHNCRRFALEGRAWNEGDVQIPVPRPYGIPYRAIVPKARECRNLLVPVCVSASHIAYGSVRMEPVFMALGQSAAVAAGLAMELDTAVQEVPYASIKDQLLARRQVLTAE